MRHIESNGKHFSFAATKFILVYFYPNGSFCYNTKHIMSYMCMFWIRNINFFITNSLNTGRNVFYIFKFTQSITYMR